MDSVAEGKMAARIRARDVEARWLGERRLVAIGGAEQQQYVRTLRDGDATDLGVFQRAPPPRHDRRAEAEDFVHGAGNQRRVCHQSFPVVAMKQQFAQAIGYQRRRGFMAREQNAVENAGDLVVADLGTLLLQANEIARQIVGWARMALRDKGAAIVP